MPVLVAAVVACALLGSTLRAAVYDSAALSTAGTVFSGIFVQALPFLALGVVLSALIAVFVTAERLSRWLPADRRQRCLPQPLAVPHCPVANAARFQ